MFKTTSRAAGPLQALTLACLLLAGAAVPAMAQSDYEPSAAAPIGPQGAVPDPNEPPKRRLDRLEREVNEVRSIVLQARATGRPVEIKDAGPDPDVVALQSKLDDIETTLRNQTGQLEVMGHDLGLAKQDAADAKAAAAGLADRVDKLEKQLAALTTPPPPPAPPANEAAVPPAGAGPAAPAGDGGDPKADYNQAKQLLLNGDYPSAAAAFQAYIDNHSDQPNVNAARYWLGEVKFAQEDYNGAASVLIAAIRGWPQTSWAPDAVLKLSLSLIRLNKPDDACSTLTEFERRYPHAPAALKARAATARVQAQCAK